MNAPEGGLKHAVQRKGSLVNTLRAVAWSFFGVRKSADHARDLSELNPLHVVIAGVLGAVLFILLLVGLVNWVLSSGMAA